MSSCVILPRCDCSPSHIYLNQMWYGPNLCTWIGPIKGPRLHDVLSTTHIHVLWSCPWSHIILKKYYKHGDVFVISIWDYIHLSLLFGYLKVGLHHFAPLAFWGKGSFLFTKSYLVRWLRCSMGLRKKKYVIYSIHTMCS